MATLGERAGEAQLSSRQELVSSLTTIMWATFFPMGCLGALLSYLRLRYFMVTVLNRFRCALLPPSFISPWRADPKNPLENWIPAGVGLD